MIKIGMIIGDRYEILEKIGTGGMSDVYKAKCHKLNRYVAIKVLKQEFSENTNFVSKFRVEAQAAAGLMHPNIVNVYDVGEEDGIYYIVMELVEGITLKNYIEKKARLSVIRYLKCIRLFRLQFDIFLCKIHMIFIDIYKIVITFSRILTVIRKQEAAFCIRYIQSGFF